MSAATHFGALPTEIPEDFLIDNGTTRASTTVQIPPGATHLMLGPHDSLFGDNTDANADFKARLTEVSAPCYADCDTTTGVGVLDIFDLLCFQNRFDANEPYACDCDTGTGMGVCDIFDFLCFQNAYDAGCP